MDPADLKDICKFVLDCSVPLLLLGILFKVVAEGAEESEEQPCTCSCNKPENSNVRAVAQGFLAKLSDRLFLSKTMFDLMVELHAKQPALMALWNLATEQALSDIQKSHAPEECERYARLAFLKGFALGFRVQEQLMSKKP